MAYVGEPFFHDIFVSYGHGDVGGTGQSRLKRWSQGFVRELEGELQQFPFGHDLRLFIDEDDRPSQGVDPLSPLAAQLRQEVGRSAVLIVLMSERYLDSEWCQSERDWWFDAQRGLNLPTDGRVAVVRVWPTDKPWPAAFTDDQGRSLALGFWFYDRSRPNERPQPHGWPAPGPDTGDPFRECLLDLVGVLSGRLHKIKASAEERLRARADEARLAQSEGRVLYVHGRDTQAAVWGRTCQSLFDDGFTVMPTEPETVVADFQGVQNNRDRRVELMGESDALLLVAADDGPALDADLVVVGRNDRHSARARSKRPLPCAVVDRSGLMATPRRRLAAARLGVDWIEASGDKWKPSIKEWLAGAAQGDGPR